MGQAQGAVVVAGGPGEITALYLNLASEVSVSDPTATPGEIGAFLGAPDNLYTGLGQHSVTYDLGGYRLVDGSGQDFNVYETGVGNSVEFNLIDVLVSGDGIAFFSVATTAAGALNLAGDGTSGSPADRQSYDVSGAIVASGLTGFRYIRVDGLPSGPLEGSSGFDLDAVGVASFAGVPEPSTWALMILGLGGAGALLRRQRPATA